MGGGGGGYKLKLPPNAQKYGNNNPTQGNSAYRSKLVGRYTDCRRNNEDNKERHPVPGSPGPEPAGALATARPSSHPSSWDTNGFEYIRLIVRRSSSSICREEEVDAIKSVARGGGTIDSSEAVGLSGLPIVSCIFCAGALQLAAKTKAKSRPTKVCVPVSSIRLDSISRLSVRGGRRGRRGRCSARSPGEGQGRTIWDPGRTVCDSPPPLISLRRGARGLPGTVNDWQLAQF
jgi:hypothetical protein